MESRNPWFSIWTHPRATVAKIAAENPNRSLWLLASIYGFCSLMSLFQSLMVGVSLGLIGIVILAIVFAPIWGWLNFSIWSLFVNWVGKWFRGHGSFKTVRCAYAWSCVPILVNVPLWLLMVALFGQQLFLEEPAPMMATGQAVFFFAVLAIKVVLAIWSLVIYLNALAQVEKFSILRSIFTVVIAAILVSIVATLFWSGLLFILS